jgi:hypothetical protein
VGHHSCAWPAPRTSATTTNAMEWPHNELGLLKGEDGTSSSDFALAKSESYSTLTLPVLNRWIANKRPRSNHTGTRTVFRTVFSTVQGTVFLSTVFSLQYTGHCVRSTVLDLGRLFAIQWFKTRKVRYCSSLTSQEQSQRSWFRRG